MGGEEGVKVSKAGPIPFFDCSIFRFSSRSSAAVIVLRLPSDEPPLLTTSRLASSAEGWLRRRRRALRRAGSPAPGTRVQANQVLTKTPHQDRFHFRIEQSEKAS